MSLKYINRIGIELEGGWEEARMPENPVTDTSVTVSADYVGESVSPPLKYSLISQWVKRNIPSKINDSCGTHVHVSFNKKNDYVRLMDEKFNNFFLDKMEDYGKNIMKFPNKHPFWARLNDSNAYCARDFRPEEQAYRTDKRGPRYSQLNFCHSLHGTLECRIFPGFTEVSDVMAAVDCFINCVEEYLESSDDNLSSILEFEVSEEELEVLS